MGSYNDPYALRSVAELPPHFRSIFNFRYFNSLQSECFSVCFHSDKSMVISAPTGSGKTVLFELCILRLLLGFLSPDLKFNHVKGVLKTIYIAPAKALVQEKVRDWTKKFGSLNINCLEMTGDNEFFNFKSIQDSDIILTTPEKFDSVTRHGIRDGGLSFFSDIALVLIDEVHLLNDPRGAALEAVISRLKMLSRVRDMKGNPLASVRFVAVSATIPNIGDIGEWLQAPPEGIKKFGEEMRPVKLTTKVLGYAPAKNDFLFERRLQNFVFEILMQHSKGKSALVFCSTRKGAQEAAQCLSKAAQSLAYANPFVKSVQQRESLKEASLNCSDKQLQACILNGVGYHNGGLGLKDRSLIEGLFLKGNLQVLCTTNTLALGINLPAHTVIIKSTQFFNKEKGSYVEYERSMMLQMCGRAGRPPFDDTGTVIIMTRKETVHLYENLLNGCEKVESQLLTCAVEHLNAEIVQMTISDITLAIEWLKCSYLYIRIKKNPENYGIKRGIPRDLLEKHMREICVQKIHELSDYGLVWTDEDGFLLKPLDPGKMMTKYYLKFETMKLIVKAPGSSSLEDVLHVICHSAEISWIQIRRNDKRVLNNIHTDKEGRMLFHVLGENGKRKKRIMTREEKIFVLANDYLTGDPQIHDLSLGQEASSICSNGCRVAKCMKEYFIYKKSYKASINSMILAKCLHQKLWDNSPFLLKQLPGIGIITAKALQSAGIDSFEKLESADARKIEIITGRNYPFGNQIKESLLALPPRIEVQIEEFAVKRGGKPSVCVKLSRLPRAFSSKKYQFADIVVGSEEDNIILFHEKIRAEEFPSPYSFTVSVPCPRKARVTLKVDLIFDEYVGLDVHKKHIISRDPTFEFERFYNITQKDTTHFLTHPKENPKEISNSSVNPKETGSATKLVGQKSNPLSKEVFIIEDDENDDISEPQVKLNDDDISKHQDKINTVSRPANTFDFETIKHQEKSNTISDPMNSFGFASVKPQEKRNTISNPVNTFDFASFKPQEKINTDPVNTFDFASFENPSFDLGFDLPAEDYFTNQPEEKQLSETKNTCTSTVTSTVTTTVESTFNHIPNKSRDFPSPTVSKPTDSSFQPSILKKRKIDQQNQTITPPKSPTSTEPSASFKSGTSIESMTSIESCISVGFSDENENEKKKGRWVDIVGYYQGVMPDVDIDARMKEYCESLFSVDSQDNECFKDVFSLFYE
ncbi:hypothetical protein LUZ60_007542 [Juncus effusus]|nr:hypothetical protein LUZ60_007542 [Juncus effusus]